MESRSDRLEGSLDWFIGLNVENYNAIRDADVFNAAHDLALRTVGLFFDDLPEVQMIGSVTKKFNKKTQRDEAYYRPVLDVIPAELLRHDLSGRLERLQDAMDIMCEYHEAQTTIQTFLRAPQLEVLMINTPMEETCHELVETMLKSPLINQVIIGDQSLEEYDPSSFKKYTLECEALIDQIGLSGVILKELKFSHEAPLPIENTTLHFYFNSDESFIEEFAMLDYCRSIMMKRQRATFVCEVAIQEGKQSCQIRKAKLVRIIHDEPLQVG